jgi:hypothetical protein
MQCLSGINRLAGKKKPHPVEEERLYFKKSSLVTNALLTKHASAYTV